LPVLYTACVQVPEEFAEELASAGFDEIEPVRGGGFEAQAVVALMATDVGLAANLVTIVVAKDAVADFVRRLRFWMSRHTGSDPGSEFVIEVTSQSPGARLKFRLVSRRSESDAAPQMDVAAMVSLLHGVFAADSLSADGAASDGSAGAGLPAP
jgi:hypothetical protein